MRLFFITGTSRGIGKAIAELLLADEKNKVIGIGRTSTIEHPQYGHHYADLSDRAVLKHFNFEQRSEVEEYYLINNAGSLGDIKHIGEVSMDSIDSSITINLIAPAMLINAFVRDLNDGKRNLKILNISSGAANRAIESWSSYCASKAGLDMFSLVAAEDLAVNGNENVVIRSVAPGVIETAMQEQIRDANDHDFLGVQHFRSLKSEGRLKSPNQTAAQLVDLIIGSVGNAEVIQRLD